MNKKQPFVVDSSVIVKWVNSQNEKYVEEANNILDDARADIQGKTKNIKVLALGNYSVDS